MRKSWKTVIAMCMLCLLASPCLAQDNAPLPNDTLIQMQWHVNYPRLKSRVF